MNNENKPIDHLECDFDCPDDCNGTVPRGFTDTDRLNYLIENETFVESTTNGKFVVYQSNYRVRTEFKNTPREAIDAAMKAGL